MEDVIDDEDDKPIDLKSTLGYKVGRNHYGKTS